MNWIPTLNLWQTALLAMVPIGIILLYFLKLRREPVEVPSTYLWARTVEDLHVNSLLQRLKRNLLLLLQLLAIALAALALLRPGHHGESSKFGRLVFLLDTSGSMLATDLGSDKDENRFAKAKRLIGERIDAMRDNDQAMLVTFDDRPNVLQAFTKDRNRLKDALRRAEVTNRSTDILGALKAADGLANPRRSSESGDVNDVQVADALPAELLMYTDGAFEPVMDFDLGNLVPEYIDIGSGNPENLAITAFSAERNVEKPEQYEAFATIRNYGETAQSTSVSLYVDDALVDASSVDLEPGDQTGVSFSLESEEAVSLRLKLDHEDDLALDNEAFAGLTPMRTVSVLLITEGIAPLELALNTDNARQICITETKFPSYLESEEYEKRAAAGMDDLIIYDRCKPKLLPATNTFFIGSLPNDQWSWDSDEGQVVLIDLDRTHPIMRYLELYNLRIFSGRAVKGPAGTRELVASDIGPMLCLAPRDGYRDLVLGFEIISSDEDDNPLTNTTWYVERSWPTFVLNVLRYLAGAAEATGAPSFRPGSTVRLRVESALANVNVGRVGDRGKNLPTGPSGLVEVIETDDVGNYHVKDEDKLVDMFAVNLFDQRESDIKVAPAVDLGFEDVQATTKGIEIRREYWRLLLIAMLIMVACEWWLYVKRIA